MADDFAKPRLGPILAALLTLAVAAAAGYAGWRYWPRSVADTAAPPTPVEPAAPETLTPGGDYYAHVKLIEAAAEFDGDAWDAGGGAPDLYHQLYWNGTKIFAAEERDDRLIAEWDLLRLDLKDALLTGEVDVATAMAAPLLRAEGTLKIIVFDDDPTFNDTAGEVTLELTVLRPGVNVIEPEAGGVRRIVLDMIPRDLPLPDLLERASNR